MAFFAEGSKLSFNAGADITACTVVKLSAAGLVVPLAATSDVPLGVACNGGPAGTGIAVQVAGVAKLLTTSAAIACGGRVQGNASGVGIATATGGYSVGVALEGNGSAAVYIPVALVLHSKASA